MSSVRTRYPAPESLRPGRRPLRRPLGASADDSKIPAALEKAATLVAGGFKVPIAAVYRLSEIKKVVEHTLRGGKVLLDVAEG
jgi:hypothetical protein